MQGYEQLKDGVKSKLGIDLHSYKEQQMRRRINQWLERHDLTSYQQLLSLLKEDRDHQAQFMKYLTINTSNFFSGCGSVQKHRRASTACHQQE